MRNLIILAMIILSASCCFAINSRIDGSTNDELQILVQDDLTDLTTMTVTINAHKVK